MNDFSLNPMTGNLATVNNTDSIKQALKNLILTDRSERYYQPLVGSKVKSQLFELYTPDTYETIRSTVLEACALEPRAKDVEVKIEPYIDQNAVIVTIKFTPINVPETTSFSIILKRVR